MGIIGPCSNYCFNNWHIILKKLIVIEPMVLNFPWYCRSLTAYNKNRNLEVTIYQKHTLDFNDQIKWAQQSTEFTWYYITYSQSINYDKCNNKTITLATAFLKPAWEENP